MYHDNSDIQVINQFFGNDNDKIFTQCDVGMGCCVYYHRNDVDSLVEKFYMHGDNWGDYGEDSNDVPALNNFVDGYKYVN